jgi:hypothetical protein
MTDARLAAELERPPISGSARCRSHRVFVYRPDDPRRQELERFVGDVFAARHGARVCSFMPTLLGMRNETGNLCGVAGFRCAARQPLFLEHYLDDPIERAIEAAARRPVSRAQIVEVGNLAAVTCRSAMRLVLELPRMLLGQGQQWMVFTATDSLRQLLARYHAPLFDLGAASAERVRHMADEWGRYYETHPRVMVGYLPDGLNLTRHRG